MCTCLLKCTYMHIRIHACIFAQTPALCCSLLHICPHCAAASSTNPTLCTASSTHTSDYAAASSTNPILLQPPPQTPALCCSLLHTPHTVLQPHPHTPQTMLRNLNVMSPQDLQSGFMQWCHGHVLSKTLNCFLGLIKSK